MTSKLQLQARDLCKTQQGEIVHKSFQIFIVLVYFQIISSLL